MPNRVLRDWTGSDKIVELSVHGERFFTRLIMKVDDFGRYPTNPKLLKPHLFPLLIDQIRETDITRWTAECERAGLIAVYEFASKQYLQIVEFNQRLRIKKAKFPGPQGFDTQQCQTHDGHTTDTRQSHDGVKRNETKRKEKKIYSSSAASSEKNTGASTESIQAKTTKLYQQLTEFVPTYGKDMIRAFFDYWTEPNKSNTRIRMDDEKSWDLSRRLKRWSDNNSKFQQKPPEAKNSMSFV